MRIIGGKYRGKKLISPLSDKVRPTSDKAREALFNILRSRLGANFRNLKLLEDFKSGFKYIIKNETNKAAVSRLDEVSIKNINKK